MKRFLFVASATSVVGNQTFYADAETEAEALAIVEDGRGEIYAEQLEVQDLGEFVFDSETEITDFGDFPPPKNQ